MDIFQPYVGASAGQPFDYGCVPLEFVVRDPFAAHTIKFKLYIWQFKFFFSLLLFLLLCIGVDLMNCWLIN